MLAPSLAQNNVSALQALVAQLVAQVQAAQNLVNAVQRTSATAGANDHVVVVDYYLGSGTQCGPRTITGWTENVDYWREDGAANTASKRLTASTGIFVPPKAGWYKICAYSRFQNSGNSVDMCIRKGSTRIACYGNAIQNDWRTTGVCTIQTLATTDTISLYLESGGSSDCVQETSWRYNRISIHMIMQSP